MEKLSAYDKLHIVPIKGVECQTWRCDHKMCQNLDSKK